MFDFSWGELLLIGAVALIVIGPKELPSVLRTVGQWTTKIRRMAGEFQSQFQEAMREAEMADLKKEVDSLNDAAKGFSTSLATHLDPLDSSESTKWEPKPEAGSGAVADANSEDVKSAIEAARGTPTETTGAVTADDYSAAANGAAEPMTPAVQAVTADGYSPPVPIDAAAAPQAPAAAPEVETVDRMTPAVPSAPAITPAPGATPSASEIDAPIPEGGGRA